MRRLDQYILKAIAGPAATAFCVVTVLMMVNELRIRAGRIPIEFVSFTDFLAIIGLLVPTIIPAILPVTYFLGALFALSALAQRGELIAFRAAGVSPIRIAFPILCGGLVLSVISFAVQEYVQPRTARIAYTLMFEEIPRRASLDRLAPAMLHRYADWEVYFEARAEDGTLQSIDLTQPRSEGGSWVYHAASAAVTEESGGYTLSLLDGHFITPENLRSDFERTELRLPAPGALVSDRDSRAGNTLPQLLDGERTLREEYAAYPNEQARRRLLRQQGEIRDRLGDPAAALALSFLAAPIGARVGRVGRSYAFALGSGVVAVYYSLNAVMVPREIVSLAELAWRALGPSLLLMATGAILLVSVNRVRR